MRKIGIAGMARIALVCFGASLCPAAHGDTSAVELPPLRAHGKKDGGSRFEQIRNRSRDVLGFRPEKRWRDPNLIASLVDETTIPGAQIWMYPGGTGYPLPAMTDAKAYEGRASLEVTLKADAYSGGAVCSQAPIDIEPYIEKGMLELWVQGEQGEEVFSIGLLDNGDNPAGRPLQAWVNSRSFAKVEKGKWTRIRVPLKAYGPRGSYWSEEVNARIFSVLNRHSISCFSFDIDKERFKSFRVWFDNVRLYKVSPPGQAVGGVAYPLSNENFEDFPAAGTTKGGKP